MGRRMKEEWKPIPDYPGYSVSSHGNVRGKQGRILKRQHGKRGGNYPFVNLTRWIDKKWHRKNANIHVLVAEFFISPRPEEMIVDHIDRNRENCYVGNLQYITQGENVRRIRRHKK